MLYLVGLGLHDDGDLSLKGLDALKCSDRVYLEGYTSKFGGDLSRLEGLSGKKIVILDRKSVEEDAAFIDEAVDSTISLLVLGDPLSATTHSDILLQCHRKGVEVRVIHSSSIFSGIGEVGLQLYKYGRTTTLAYPEGDYFPTSPYDVIRDNLSQGMHTLVLLDVKADEDRYMSVAEACGLLLRMGKEKGEAIIGEDTRIVGASRLGGDRVIAYGKLSQVMEKEFGGPPHIVIIPGKLHFAEEDVLKLYPV
ncbi:diphthine synthase [Candidatus Altiarchaeota archaeon]